MAPLDQALLDEGRSSSAAISRQVMAILSQASCKKGVGADLTIFSASAAQRRYRSRRCAGVSVESLTSCHPLLASCEPPTTQHERRTVPHVKSAGKTQGANYDPRQSGWHGHHIE